MPERLIFVCLLILFSVAAFQVWTPSSAAPATGRYVAGTAAVLLGVAIVAVLADAARRRRARRRERARGLLADPRDRRDAYRVPYPEGEGPTLHLGDPRRLAQARPGFEVRDLSEEGLRVRLPEGSHLGDTFAGWIAFPGGRTAQVAGVVLRQSGDLAAVRLTRAVPPEVVVAEQVRLREFLIAVRRGQVAAPPEGGPAPSQGG
ncbi:MAG: PilZ domain-containing protein [Deferrisomatales bacterium]